MKVSVGARIPTYQVRKGHVDRRPLLSTVMFMEQESKYQNHLRGSALRNVS